MEYIWIDNFIGYNHGCDVVIEKSLYLDKSICVCFIFIQHQLFGMALKVYVLLQSDIYCN